MGKITSFKETEDGRFLIELKGIIRFQIIRELKSNKKYRYVKLILMIIMKIFHKKMKRLNLLILN